MRFTALSVVACLLAPAVSAFQLCQADTGKLDALKTVGANNAVTGYSLVFDAGLKEYNPNVAVNVTVPGGGNFQQILLYAAENRYGNHSGTWVNYDKGAYETLDGKDETSNPAGCAKLGLAATLASKNTDAKTLPATFQWLPPATPTSGSIRFWGIVVKSPELGYTYVYTEGVKAQNPYPQVQANSASAATGCVALLLASVASGLLFL
ncbi:hypothetical protein PhCBS80983_g04081 [Powellomyces hirtus]|uniref:Reelin domain-containing protein n=1 Tax=Powellomyces hirtus TaxID=109895 RepID=A0A507DZ96_9FUNG|nr:hypothetical protein PhCBS80983_g04081 [Powellomyces hirtus]